MTSGFAQLFISCRDIKDVVDNLKDHAVSVSEIGERVNSHPIVTGNDAADAGSSAVKRGSFTVD